MASIDANDDTKTRWIVYHYRYDPERRERRDVAVACFDNRKEFRRFLEEAGRKLQDAKNAGTAEAKEHIIGRPRQAGYDHAWKIFREWRRDPTGPSPWPNSMPGFPQLLTSESPSVFRRAKRWLTRRWSGRFKRY
jgi:hypothetical protein